MPLLNAASLIALAEVRDLCTTGRGRAIREAADLSLREVAQHLGISAATLSCWERGAQRPTGDRALHYHQLLLELTNRRALRVMSPAVRS